MCPDLELSTGWGLEASRNRLGSFCAKGGKIEKRREDNIKKCKAVLYRADFDKVQKFTMFEESTHFSQSWKTKGKFSMRQKAVDY